MTPPYMTPPYRLAAICHENDKPVALAAAQQLADAVSKAMAAPWAISLNRCTWDDCPPDQPLLLFLRADADIDEPIAATDARWRQRLDARRSEARPPIFLVNLYRCIADPDANVSIARIRALDLLAIDLSRDYDLEVVDIDRRFALIGAKLIGSDYRCDGERAAQIAGHSIATAILACGLDAHLPADVQQRALAGLQEGGDLRTRLAALQPEAAA